MPESSTSSPGPGRSGSKHFREAPNPWISWENRAEALHSLKANVAALRETKRTRLFKRDAIPFAGALEEHSYDIAFVDAPYGSKKLDRILDIWTACHFARILGVEHARDHDLPSKRLRGRTRFKG